MLKITRGMLSVALAALTALPVPALAGEHVVSSGDLKRELAAQSSTRAANEQKLRAFVGSGAARGVMAAAKINPVKVEQAIPSLSDAELARLAAKSSEIDNQFAAGLTNAQITYIILGGILIIVIAILAS